MNNSRKRKGLNGLLAWVFSTSWMMGVSVVWAEEDGQRFAQAVVLTEAQSKNLGLEFAEAEIRDFEETFFTLGRIEEIPRHHAVLSSRIAGRIVRMEAFVGDEVKKGQELVAVESRQPGSPPPVILLRAPRTGLVVRSHVREGEPVEPDRELLDIVDLSRVWAVAQIPEELAQGLEPGTMARVRVRAVEGVREGRLLRFGVEAKREQGTVEAIFELENDDLQLRPGMLAEFSIVRARREGVLKVPRSAVQGDRAKPVVYVQDFEIPNAFHPSPVVLGAENDEGVEILSGLFPGDMVVSEGAYFLAFAGADGPSLKEALDAAHGHEHNEDGGEITPEQRAQREAPHAEVHGEVGESGDRCWKWLAGGMGVLALIFAQLWWRARREEQQKGGGDA